MKSPLAQRMENLEQTIEEITNRLEELNHLPAKPDTYKNGTDIAALNREYNELRKSLEKHNRQWEQADIELETLKESFWQEKTLVK
jgi:protein subunit release factor A